MKASCELVGMTDAQIAGVAVLIELGYLSGRSQLAGVETVHAVLRY